MGLRLELLTGEVIAVPDAIVDEGPEAIDAFHRHAHEVLGLGPMYEANQQRAVIYAGLRATRSEAEALAAIDPSTTDTTAPGAGEE